MSELGELRAPNATIMNTTRFSLLSLLTIAFTFRVACVLDDNLKFPVVEDCNLMPHVELNKINSYLIRKQHLTDEARGGDLVKVVRDIGGLHATSPTTPYLSLLARMREFEKEDLEKELYMKRTLGKIRYVRNTMYVLTRQFIPTAFAATRKMAEPKSEAYSKFLGISEKEYKLISKRIIELLRGKGGKTTKSIKEELGSKLNISPIVNLMCDQGLLIRGAPQKGWKSNLHTYHLFNEYFSNIRLDRVGEADARRMVVEVYISTFGPVTETDIAWWTGFPQSQISQIINDLKDKVAHVETSAAGDDYLVSSQQIDSLMSMRPIRRNVANLLPRLDPYVISYKERDRYLDSENHHYVFDPAGNATSTILLNGETVGIWDVCEKVSPLIKLFLFERVPKRMLKDIHVIAKRTGKFIMEKEVQIKECDSMTSLTHRTAGGFMSPLKDS